MIPGSTARSQCNVRILSERGRANFRSTHGFQRQGREAVRQNTKKWFGQHWGSASLPATSGMHRLHGKFHFSEVIQLATFSSTPPTWRGGGWAGEWQISAGRGACPNRGARANACVDLWPVVRTFSLTLFRLMWWLYMLCPPACVKFPVVFGKFTELSRGPLPRRRSALTAAEFYWGGGRCEIGRSAVPTVPYKCSRAFAGTAPLLAVKLARALPPHFPP